MKFQRLVRSGATAGAVATAVVLAGSVPALAAPVGDTTRVSVSSDGTEANGASGGGMVSGNGRYVVFYSSAENLVTGDTLGNTDVFRYDRETGITVRVSVADDESEANNGSGDPSVSYDGRYVAFDSAANNLIGADADTNKATDVFVRDMVDGTTTRVSVQNDETQAFGNSWRPTISADGTVVAFLSAEDLETGQGRNQVWVRDITAGTTTMVSVDNLGDPGNEESLNAFISADGSTVAFESQATDLVADDTNSYVDIFVHTRATHVTERVSVDSNETPADADSQEATLSSTGRYVAFRSRPENFVGANLDGDSEQIFIRDRQLGTTTLITPAAGTGGNNSSTWPFISANGKFVAFESDASDLVADDTNNNRDVFLADLTAGTIELVSVSTAGVHGNYTSEAPSLSADGSVVEFESTADNLVYVGAQSSCAQVATPLDPRTDAAIANDLNCTMDEFARQVMETLPATGTDPTALVVLGVVLIAAGGVLVSVRRPARATRA